MSNLNSLLSLEDAQARLLALAAALPIERVDVASSLGRFWQSLCARSAPNLPQPSPPWMAMRLLVQILTAHGK